VHQRPKVPSAVLTLYAFFGGDSFVKRAKGSAQNLAFFDILPFFRDAHRLIAKKARSTGLRNTMSLA